MPINYLLLMLTNIIRGKNISFLACFCYFIIQQSLLFSVNILELPLEFCMYEENCVTPISALIYAKEH